MPLEALPMYWDVVVVGAGVAGSAAALRAARAGLRVLLVEKSDWPRDKACGGCLNAAALGELGRLGVTNAAELGGRPYAAMTLAACGRQATFPLPRGRAITRRQLDAALAERAVKAGACFLIATRASLGGLDARARTVWLRRNSQVIAVTASLVLDCSGLAGRLSVTSAADAFDVTPNAYIGLGTTLVEAPPFYRPETIHMACGRHGYVGLVRVANDRLDVGAALDPAWIKRAGGPARAISTTLSEAGFPIFEALLRARWHGTPRLTCRRRLLGKERLFVLGDAAGYVEPFTGEGMAWALADAAAIHPFVLTAVARWQDDLVTRWAARHNEANQMRRRVCLGVSRLLRHPRLLTVGLPLLASAPMAVKPLTAWLNHDFRLDRAAVE